MPFEIVSRQNQRLRDFLKQRDRFFCFAGEKLVQDIMERGIEVSLLVLLRDTTLPSSWRARETWLVSPEVMRKVSPLKEAPRAVAVIEQLTGKIDFRRHSRIIALHEVQDPGNAGTICRTAAAFGMDAVVLCGKSVNSGNDKFLRAAQTSLFDLCLATWPESDSLLAAASGAGHRVFLTGRQENPIIPEKKLIKPPFLILFGSEGQGIPPRLQGRYPSLGIVHNRSTESLNVAVAAGIIMHELAEMKYPAP